MSAGTQSALARAGWPVGEACAALEALAAAAGLEPRLARSQQARVSADPLDLNRSLLAAAEWLGLEAEPVEVDAARVDALLAQAAPALIFLPGEEPLLVPLLGHRRGQLLVLGPDGARHRVAREEVRGLLSAPLEAEHREAVESLLRAAAVPERRRARSRRALLEKRLEGVRLRAGVILRPAPQAGLRVQLQRAGLGRLLALLFGAQLLQWTLLVASGWLLGGPLLEGRFDPGLLVGWALLLATALPLQLTASWAAETLSLRGAALLKQQLLAGALRLLPEEIRHQGSGQLLGRVLEADRVEALAVGGGLGLATSLVELGFAVLLLAVGAGGALQALLLLAWVLLALWLVVRSALQRRRWTRARLSLTHDLVEAMAGHRTRLAQQPEESWHRDEDRSLAGYLGSSRLLDRLVARIEVLLPQGWLLLGLACLAPAFADDAGAAPLAVALGGVLLGQRALRRFAQGLSSGLSALVAGGEVAELLDAACRAPTPASPEVAEALAGPRPRPGELLLTASGLSFRHQARAEPVLRGVDLEVREGDRLLLEGPSGGGKSTLAALLCGLREPAAGLLQLRGLDRATTGWDEWRSRIAAAPQFHENHVFSASLGFNLLLGCRAFRPGLGAEVDEVCRGLGLSELVARMPAGLDEQLGETGWQLSHGERSRLFMARALLQRPELLVLDESFAALDPETLRRCLRFVLARARSVLVIAHP